MPKIDLETEGLEFFELDDTPYAWLPKSKNLFLVLSDNQLSPTSPRRFADILQNGRAISKSEALRLASLL